MASGDVVDPIRPAGNFTAEHTFEADNGGLGLSLEATEEASTAVALPVPRNRAYIITNDGAVTLWYGFGGPSFEATLAYLPVLPGTSVPGTLPLPEDDGQGGPVWTHISTITRGGTTTATINFGKGR